MASKICPSCGAKNPSDAYSCYNCATSLIDVPLPTFGPNSSASSASWTTYPSSNSQNIPYSKPPQQPNPPLTGSSLSIAAQPVAVVQQSPVRGIINALITMAFVIFFGIGFGITQLGALIAVVILAAIIAIPVILGFLMRSRFEFYDSYLQRSSRTNNQQIEYSEMKSVEKFRSTIRIELKSQTDDRFRQRGILIPGDPKLSDGTDLSTWLKKKVPSAEPQKDSSSRNSSEDTD